MLTTCNQQMKAPVDDGQFGMVIGPTILSKEIALALEDRLSEAGESGREHAASAIRRLVLAAWELDYYSDTGNRQKLAETYGLFSAAITDIASAYDVKP